MHEFRANALPLLPLRVDKNGEATGKRIVNNADLVANGFPLHTVKLPVRSGNNLPESAGATLVVVYRDPNPDRAQNPLRKLMTTGRTSSRASTSRWSRRCRDSTKRPRPNPLG